MLTTPHVLLGLYFAQTYSPWIGLPAAFISHFLFDYFYPHWNPHLFTEKKTLGHFSLVTWKVILADIGVALFLVGVFVRPIWSDHLQVITLLAGAFLAVMPDILEIPYYLFNSTNPWLCRFVDFERQHQARANLFWGLIFQGALMGICWWGLKGSLP